VPAGGWYAADSSAFALPGLMAGWDAGAQVRGSGAGRPADRAGGELPDSGRQIARPDYAAVRNGYHSGLCHSVMGADAA